MSKMILFLPLLLAACATERQVTVKAPEIELVMDKQMQPMTRNEVIMAINECEKNDTFFFDAVGLELLINELFTCLVHEKRHRYQFRKKGKANVRRYKSSVADLDLKYDMEYYGDADEIDAYAQEAVIEMRLIGYSASMEKYQELFAKNDPVVYNRFLKKCYKFEDKISL